MSQASALDVRELLRLIAEQQASLGNLQQLVAFLAYSTPRGRQLARYSPGVHGRKEFKGYWRA